MSFIVRLLVLAVILAVTLGAKNLRSPEKSARKMRREVRNNVINKVKSQFKGATGAAKGVELTASYSKGLYVFYQYEEANCKGDAIQISALPLNTCVAGDSYFKLNCDGKTVSYQGYSDSKCTKTIKGDSESRTVGTCYDATDDAYYYYYYASDIVSGKVACTTKTTLSGVVTGKYLQMTFYNDSKCKSTYVISATMQNQCISYPSYSYMYAKPSMYYYSTDDCSGTSSKSTVSTKCAKSGSSSYQYAWLG